MSTTIDKCLLIARSNELDDDEKLIQIEDLLTREFPDLQQSQIERKVLDIMLNQTTLLSESSKEQEPEMSEEQLKSKDTDVDLSLYPPFDQLRLVLGANSNEDLERVLASQDYDFYRTVKLLQGHITPLTLSKEETSRRIVCRYFIQGHCMRGNGCLYSHDTKSKICRYWLHNRCIAPNCPFLHGIPPLPELEPKKVIKSINLQNLPQLNSSAKPASKLPSTQTQTISKPTSQKDLRQSLKRVSEVLPHSRSGLVLEPPKFTPWKSNFGNNSEYMKLRQQAMTLANERNTLLQQSTSYWQLNDGLRAKKQSVKGQKIHDEMIEIHRKAAEILWDHTRIPGSEVWVDLHGLELVESIEMFDHAIKQVKQMPSKKIVYVITGRGHYFAKSYADQMSQFLDAYLDAKGFLHRKTEVNLDYGRVTIVDPYSSIADQIQDPANLEAN